MPSDVVTAVGMADLSPEIICLIASYLPRWEIPEHPSKSGSGRAVLPAYATISRSWQYAIESLTMHQLAIKSTEIEYFSRVIVDHRRTLLTLLHLNVILPTYSDKACAKFETAQDKQLNSQVFTTAIKDLLTLLRSWHDEFQASRNNNGTIARPLQLRIGDCYSPKDCTHRGYKQFEEDTANWELGKRRDLFKHRYESSLLELGSIEEIPDVPQVTFFIRSSSERFIEPRSLALLSAKFPNIDGFRWTLNDNERLDNQLRQQTRLHFAEALSQVPQSSLKRLHINFYYKPPNNHDMKPPSVVEPCSPPIDRLSLAIHRLSLSRNLTHLDLGDCIVISPSLFWPDCQSKVPFWPNLVWVRIVFNMTTADGDWYYIGDENLQVDSDASSDAATDSDPDSETDSSSSHSSGTPPRLTHHIPDINTPDIYNTKAIDLATGDKPSRQFRSRADQSKLNPLFMAAAKAACQMPRLQRMMLKCEVKGPRYFNLVMNYYGVGQNADRGAGATDVDRPRLEWLVGMSRYEPEDEILEIWREGKGDVLESVRER